MAMIIGTANGAGAADLTPPPPTSLKFEHHFVDTSLEIYDCGQTAIADLDNDGKPDFVLGKQRGDLYWYQYEGGLGWTRHTLGHQSPSDVGAACVDVDGDGRLSILSKPWSAEPWNACQGKFHVDCLKNVGPFPAGKTGR